MNVSRIILGLSLVASIAYGLPAAGYAQATLEDNAAYPGVRNAPGAFLAGTYYVATDGSDATGDGSAAAPWATITHALDEVPDGNTVLVRPGDYMGRVRLRGTFTQGITVRAEVPYQARLRNGDDKVITTYDGARGITLSGFDIAHSALGAPGLVVHVDGGGTEGYVTHLSFTDNIFHDSYNNDILKINNGATHITVRGNMFYNQAGSDEHIDVNSVKDVIIEDNIFFNVFGGSGRSNDNDTSAFVVVKDSNASSDWVLGSERVTLRRNIFLNWEGSNGYGFIQIGEDGTANFEARDVLIENNLMLGNAANDMRSPIGIMGSRDVTIRNNTVVGDLPSNAFAMRLYAYGDNQDNENLAFYNNIWADPTGTMDDFSDTPSDQTASFTLANNLYWNGGAAIPSSDNDLVNYMDDTARIVGDPQLSAQAGLIPPRWDAGEGQFAGGYATLRAAFEGLVVAYGVPSGSAALDAADPAHAPADDILGMPRPAGSAPELGAYEVAATMPTLALQAQAMDQAIALSWQVNGQLPSSTTWQIGYQSESGTSVMPAVTGLISSTRAYILTDLTNGLWYTVSLSTDPPLLTATAQARPVGFWVYLPVVLKE